MKLNRILFPALLLIMAGIAMTGCSNPESPTPPFFWGTDWTAVADSGDTSTKITLTFAAAVTELNGIDIEITPGTGTARKLGVTKISDTVYELGITVTQAGTVFVLISKAGILPGPKEVTVKLGSGPPPGGEDPGETGIGGNLGPVTAVNSATQKGWATNGADGLTTTLDVVTLINAQYLKLVLGQKPSHGVQIIWQGDGNAWAWTQTDISSGTGEFDASKGAVWDEATKTLTIELSRALGDYALLKDSYQVKLFIAYYSNHFDDLGIVSADLIASPTPINFVFVTFDANGGDFNDDPLKDPILTKVVRLVSGQSMGVNFPANPLKSGFHLDKWVNASDVEYDNATTIIANVTLTAVWAAGDPVPCIVSFNTDGGSAAPDDVTINAGSSLGSKYPASPTKAGNVFAGWFDAATMSTPYTASTSITTDIVLQAKWTAIVYPSTPDTTPTATGFIKVRDLTIDGGNTEASLPDWLIGKGYVKGADFTALKNAETGSIVLIAMTSPTGKNNYGAGKFGEATFSVPNSYTAGTTFFVQVPVSSILSGLATDATQIFVNLYPDGYVIQKAELWKPDPDYVPPVGLTLYEGGELKGDFSAANITYNSDQQEIQLPSGGIDVSTYTTIFIKLEDSFDPDGYFAGQVGGFPIDTWDWVSESNWGGWILNDKTASMSLGAVKKLQKIVFKGSNNPKIENVVKIWLE